MPGMTNMRQIKPSEHVRTARAWLVGETKRDKRTVHQKRRESSQAVGQTRLHVGERNVR